MNGRHLFRFKTKTHLFFLWVLGSWVLSYSPGVSAAPLAARLIYLQGQVSVMSGAKETWQPANINQDILVGDVVKTGPDSMAALLCVDESQIKLNENTKMVLTSVMPSPRLGLAAVTPAAAKEGPGSVYQVPEGEAWIRNNKERFPFTVETPAVTAAIRGTEFNLRVSRDKISYVTLLGGKLHLANPHGELMLQPGEEGMARPGQAPLKRVLLQPADAVQWCLYYPGIFSFYDLPLAEAGAPRAPPGEQLVAQAEVSYDRGQLAEAKAAAESALKSDPRNSRALTVLGWVSLQQQQPQEAEKYFRQTPRPSDRTLIGLALAHYRLGDATGAYRLMQEARHPIRPSPLFTAMNGYFALMVGKVEPAEAFLKEALEKQPTQVLAHSLLAQIYLVRNHKAKAREEASRALSQAPGSPLAQLSMALVEIACFELPKAAKHLQEALRLDPRFVTAYVYLAKIQLGSGYLDRAWNTINQALTLAPREGEVLALAGFVRLAFRDYSEAKKYFHRAIEANPGLGEPHIGLGIYYFRYREMDRGLAAMLTATLLEPRRSLYQSELGKAFYQVRSFDKALEAYDYAMKLDKNDPTPYLYKGIALTDLNRPGEAIRELNRSIELNDNQAVFRSRIMLDQDEAVRNYNLARPYAELGMNEWVYSKAITAVKKDPTNSSAYLFLTGAYLSTGERFGAMASSGLLYRLLSPANQNTFTQFNDYTPMFEMPYWRLQIQGGVGSWRERRTIQSHNISSYGGIPGLAYYIEGNYSNDPGISRNTDAKSYYAIPMLKWEPTVKNSLFSLFSYSDGKSGDIIAANEYLVSPYRRIFERKRNVEVGYVLRFSPAATLLAYFNYANNTLNLHDFRAESGSFPYQWGPYTISGFPPGWYAYDQGSVTYDAWTNSRQSFPQEYVNFQMQQQLILGKHTFFGGVDYFSGTRRYSAQALSQVLYKNFIYGNLSSIYNDIGQLIWSGQLYPPFTAPLNIMTQLEQAKSFHPPQRSLSFYLLDYWRLHPNLLVELGLFKDIAKTPKPIYPTPIYTSNWSPRLGINYQINARHTLRLAVQQHVNTHYFSNPSLAPPDVASFPWQINIFEGGLVREVGLAWEAQWDSKTFTTLRSDIHRISNPTYITGPDQVSYRIYENYKRYVAGFILNRILGNYWGLALGVEAKKFDPAFKVSGSLDFWEYGGAAGLFFWHHSGWFSNLNANLVRQDLTDRGDTFFGLVNFQLGYQFPRKRGEAALMITNLLDHHFFYQREFLTEHLFYPARRIMFRLALYF